MKLHEYFELFTTSRFSKPTWRVRVRVANLPDEYGNGLDAVLRLHALTIDESVGDGGREYVATFDNHIDAQTVVLTAEVIRKCVHTATMEIRFGVDFEVTTSDPCDVPLCIACGRSTIIDETEMAMGLNDPDYTHRAVLRCLHCKGWELRRIRWTLFGNTH